MFKRKWGMILTLASACAYGGPANASVFGCDGPAGMDIPCYVVKGVVLVAGTVVVAGIWVADAFKDAFTTKKMLDARLEGSSEVFSVTLKGVNKLRYSETPLGRENPMPLHCVRTYISPSAGPNDWIRSEFGYASCEERRPGFDPQRMKAQDYYGYLADHPMVRFNVSKEGLADPNNAEVVKRFDAQKFPVPTR